MESIAEELITGKKKESYQLLTPEATVHEVKSWI